MKPQCPNPNVQQNSKPQCQKIGSLRNWNLFGIWSLVIGIFRNTQYPILDTRYKRGYALMLSIVVSSVVLAIGLSLLNIVRKELILSSIGRESQFAFYAADSGIECAFYWDIRQVSFPSSAADWGTNGDFPQNSGDECGNTDFNDKVESDWNANLNPNSKGYSCDEETGVCTGHEDDTVTINFQIDFSGGIDENRCALVKIIKQGNNQSGASYKVNTTVESRGYNDKCLLDSSQLVERAIQVTY